MKIGDKIIAIDPCVMLSSNESTLTIGNSYIVKNVMDNSFYIVNDNGDDHGFPFDFFDKYFKVVESDHFETPSHYDNSNGSLYLFAEQHKLNAWEFEVIKRIVRCRKKGEFLSDIEKTIKVLELYRDEQGEKYKGQIEPLNK